MPNRKTILSYVKKQLIFLFGCILENCLLSTSHHWYKFISLNSLDSKTSTSTSMFESTGINESSRLLEHSIKASYSGACNNVDTIDVHSANINSDEDGYLFSAAWRSIWRVYLFRKRSHQFQVSLLKAEVMLV